MIKEWICPKRKHRDNMGKVKIVACIEDYNGKGMCPFKELGECRKDRYHEFLKQRKRRKNG